MLFALVVLFKNNLSRDDLGQHATAVVSTFTLLEYEHQVDGTPVSYT